MRTKPSLLMTAFASLFLLGGCTSLGKTNAKKDAEVDVHLIADADINQDVLGIPSPVRLSFLQLTSEIEFRQMMQMNTDDIPYTEFLGKSVLDETNVMIRPDQMLDFKLPLNEEARYLGVVAAYRDEDNVWKNALAKQEKRWYQLKDANFLYLHITANNVVQLSKQDATEKMLAKKLKEQGKDIAALTVEEKNKLLRQMRKQMEKHQPADLSKGYFAEQPPISAADIAVTDVATPSDAISISDTPALSMPPSVNVAPSVEVALPQEATIPASMR